MKSGLLAAVVFLILPALAPQSVNGTIEGMVQRTDTKAPIAGVRVSVTTTPINGAPLYTAITGNDGRYAIADVPPGMYFILAERDVGIGQRVTGNVRGPVSYTHLTLPTNREV